MVTSSKLESKACLAVAAIAALTVIVLSFFNVSKSNDNPMYQVYQSFDVEYFMNGAKFKQDFWDNENFGGP